MTAPLTVWIGDTPIRHGERDDSELCLCGHDPYYTCPDWLDGDDTLGGLTFHLEGFHVGGPE